MAALKRINQVRRRLMQSITRNIGKPRNNKPIVLTDATDIRQILICRPNDRLGNLLLITPLLQEINNTFPNAKVDLFVKGGAAPFIFSRYDCIDRILMLPKRPFSKLLPYAGKWWSLRQKKYDLVINVEKNSSSGRLSTLFARARYKFFGEIDNDICQHYPDCTHIAKYPVYHFRHFLTTLGFRRNIRPVAPLDLKLSPDEITQGAALLRQLAGNHRRTICLFTFATGNKCYSKSWWSDCYAMLEATYPDCNFIEVLPVQNVSQLDFKIPFFYSKDLREIGSLIANADLFIGADSGIMHLSVSSQTPTVGLFAVTNIRKYAPYGSGSFGINTNETPFDQWIPLLSGLLKDLPQQPKSA